MKPDAVATTEVPAGPFEGARVTVGATMVKVTAGGAAVPSAICTVCVPGNRFKVPAPPIMKYPERAPVALVASVAVEARPLPLRVTFVVRPSTRMRLVNEV